MDAGKRTVNEIFNGSRMLEIPFFQRAYVWGKPQWERMLEDMESVSALRKPYFIGSVILKQQPTQSSENVGDVRTVIDGQQRLTTLSILLKVLCLKNDSLRKFDKRFRLDDDSTVIQHNHIDAEAYTAIMDLNSLKSMDGEDNISKAYRYFVDYLNPEKVDFDTVCNTILLVGIDLNSDEDEQQIFDTINSLGVRLTTAELLKNFFFGRNDIQDYQRYWKEIFEKDDETKAYWDKEVTTGRIKRTFIDLFFLSFLQIKMQDKTLDVKSEHKKAFAKVEQLFESYKAFIKEYCNNDKKSLLIEIRDYATIFRRIFNADSINDELPATEGIERINAIIFALDTTTLMPYVLFIERNVIEASVKSALYGYLETYIMRRLVTKSTAKNYNQLFGERLILNQVLSKDELASYLEGQEDKINRMPTDDDLKAAFHKEWLTNKYAAGVLYMIESKTRDCRKHSTQLLGINKYSLEHMMPKKWRNHWEFSGSEEEAINRDRILLTLGNLAIITQSLNASIRDADWSTKKAGKGAKGGLRRYSEGIESLSKFLDFKVWDEKSIEERADYLAYGAIMIWSI